MTDSIGLLDRLVSFPTVSRKPNLELIELVAARLHAAGIGSRLVASADGTRANLFATAGPADRPGVILSGHTDVVPVEGQPWTLPPFALTRRDGRLYGRGTADMKGFVAAAVTAVIDAAGRPLEAPLHLALSYDEEIGCVGVRSLIDLLESELPPQRLCIVGEPTSLRVATGHKGKIAARVACRGRAGHSALAPLALNALHLGCDVVGVLRAEQQRLEREGAQDPAYDIPYATVHVGRMHGGTALNIVPDQCELEFEIRSASAEDAQVILARIEQAVAALEREARDKAAEASIEIEVTNSYPGLDTAAEAGAVGFLGALTGDGSTRKVAFGTEGGLFDRQLRVPTVICGPGSMDQGHKADEFVTVDQMERCDALLGALVTRLETGDLPALVESRARV